MREFGSRITKQSWQPVFDQPLIKNKYKVFTNLLSTAVDVYFPLEKLGSPLPTNLELHQN